MLVLSVDVNLRVCSICGKLSSETLKSHFLLLHLETQDNGIISKKALPIFFENCCYVVLKRVMYKPWFLPFFASKWKISKPVYKITCIALDISTAYTLHQISVRIFGN